MRDRRSLSPETERFVQALSEEPQRLIAEIDRRELDRQRARLAPWAAAKLSEPTYSVRNQVRAWEILIDKMETGWPPDGVYYPEEYVNDLVIRDNLQELAQAFPAGLRSALDGVLKSLDAGFRRRTVDDGGAALGPWRGPWEEGRRLDWWWYRAPLGLVWAGTAGT